MLHLRTHSDETWYVSALSMDNVLYTTCMTGTVVSIRKTVDNLLLLLLRHFLAVHGSTPRCTCPECNIYRIYTAFLLNTARRRAAPPKRQQYNCSD